ncbi:YppG family protein [Caldibacillus lycopersici]|uniref:YppG family protein n=1 Tax=Perspicuibacillus lycopersici TaxID=1325689 RepID=A0AAE3IS99_9BACI|nr:YppG family protein [Perspicuibacillus lycopersici]MCU9613546.1 YppG family protein [Perspicuibacillus lycopersici]
MFYFNGRPPRRQPYSPFNSRSQHPTATPFISFFKNEDGQWDIDKITKSINQANKLVGELNPLIKQFSSFIKK